MNLLPEHSVLSVSPQKGKQNRKAMPVVGFLIASAVSWGVSLFYFDLDQMGPCGLLNVFPFSFYLSILFLFISFSLTFAPKHYSSDLIRIAQAVLLILIVHGTISILYENLRYQWAWKHVGIIDYIQRHGAVDRHISHLQAYHNWPGFFALCAFITQLAGLENALGFANWATVFFNLVNLGALMLVYRGLSDDKRVVWLGIWFFFITNWVGQDYFAPQTLAYTTYLFIVGILLNVFKCNELIRFSPSLARVMPKGVSQAIERLLNSELTAHNPGTLMTVRKKHLMGLALTLMISGIVVSHQLTPLVLIAVLAGLTLTRRSTAGIFFGLSMLLTAFWLFVAAYPYVSGQLAESVRAVGNIFSNLTMRKYTGTGFATGQQLVSHVVWAHTLFFGMLAALGFINRWIHGHRDITPLILIGAVVFVAFGVSYDGEMILRLLLFMNPWLVFMATGLFFPTNTSGKNNYWVMLPILIISLVLFIGFSFGYYGKDTQYRFTPKEKEITDSFYSTATKGAYLMTLTNNYPSFYRNHEKYRYLTIMHEPKEVWGKIRQDPAGVLTEWMADPTYPESYLLLTRSQQIETYQLGWGLPGFYATIAKAFSRAKNVEIVAQNHDASLFRLIKKKEDPNDARSESTKSE
jgi:hypothetical protein